MTASSRSPVLRAADHALAVLELLAKDVADISATELGRRLGISTPSAYRLLESLAVHDFVRQDRETKRYQLGLRPFEIASQLERSSRLVETGHRHLELLVGVTQESAHLAVWDREESLNVDKVDSPHPIFLRTGVGSRLPAHASATGKCLLAFGASYERDRFLSRLAPLERFTDKTITDLATLQAELMTTRHRGYALAVGEYHEQVVGIAAPVRDWYGVVVAAVGIGLPVQRAGASHLEELAAHVVQTSQRLSAELGCPT